MTMKVISLGLGIQSTAMYVMSCRGELDRADVAIFADPGLEHPETYKTLDWLWSWTEKNDGIPIIYHKRTALNEDILRGTNSTGHKFASIPAFTGETGMVRRQCTTEYKIRPVGRAIRYWHGLKPRQKMKPTEVWIGISTDEAGRMKDNPRYNMTNVYPLIEKWISRDDCVEYLREHKIPVAVKSSCIFCPYHSDSYWRDLKRNEPDLFDKAVEVDEAIRDMSKKGMREPIYLHRSTTPLKDIDFEAQQDLFGEGFGNECEGYCGL